MTLFKGKRAFGGFETPQGHWAKQLSDSWETYGKRSKKQKKRQAASGHRLLTQFFLFTNIYYEYQQDDLLNRR